MFQQIAKLRKRRESGEGGFTLIELLVVIIILGVLSAVVVFAVRGTGDKGKGAALKTDIQTIRTAEEAFCAKNGRYGTHEELVDQKFLSEKSTLNEPVLTGGGTCGTDALTSGYVISSGPFNPNGGGPFVVAVNGSGAGTTGVTALGLNPAVDTQGGMQNQSALLYNGLLGLDRQAKPVPELAIEVPTVANGGILNGGNTSKFKLRTVDDPATTGFDERVRWSDSGLTTTKNPTGGNRFLTAADVKFSYEAALLVHHARTNASVKTALSPLCTDPDPGTTNGRRFNCPAIVADDTVSPATISFTFGGVYAPFLQQLAMSDGAIIAQHVWETCTVPGSINTGCPSQSNRTNSVEPVGTGPFRFKSYSTSELVFDKNPNFWKAGIPYFNQVKYVNTGTSAAASLAALQTGTADFSTLASAAQVAAAKANSNLVVNTDTFSPGGSTNCTLKLINHLWARGSTVPAEQAGTATPHPQLGNVNVRKAIAMALQRKPNVNGTNAGYVTIVQQNDGSKLAESHINSGITFASKPNPLPEYDVDGPGGSKALLDAAGFPNTVADTTMPGGVKRFDMGISAFGGSQTTLANTIRDDLALVGIKVVPNPTLGSFTVTQGEMTTLYGNRNYDTLVFSNCQATDPEIGVRRLYHTSSINGSSFTNGAGYTNAQVDTWFDQGRASFDPATRASFYALIQQKLRADLPSFPLLENVSNRAWRANCTGLRPYTGHFAEYGSCLR